jgi:hypothetical protein
MFRVRVHGCAGMTWQAQAARLAGFFTSARVTPGSTGAIT